MAKSAATAPPRPYHHGNLRREILDAALDEIHERGPVAVSLRGLARRAGVSHAAPAHHFGDKAGLLTAVAVEGFELLGDALQGALEAGDFLDAGLAYIGFAVEHPAHFEVMYRPDLHRRDDPALVDAMAATTRLLYEQAGVAFGDEQAEQAGLVAWSWAHGFASLWVTGNLQSRLGDDPIAAARVVAQALFTPPRPP